eukprot:383682_1
MDHVVDSFFSLRNHCRCTKFHSLLSHCQCAKPFTRYCHKCCENLQINLWNNIYVYVLYLIISFHVIMILILDAVNENDGNKNHVSVTEYILISFLLIIEWGLIYLQLKILYRFIFLTDIKPILCLYSSTIIAFSGLYLLLFKIDSHNFYHAEPTILSQQNISYRSLSIIFINYSITTQVLAGMSPIISLKIIAEILTSIQVLVFGIGYAVFILAIAVLRFAETSSNDTGYDTYCNKQSLLQSPMMKHQRFMYHQTPKSKFALDKIDDEQSVIKLTTSYSDSHSNNSDSNVVEMPSRDLGIFGLKLKADTKTIKTPLLNRSRPTNTKIRHSNGHVSTDSWNIYREESSSDLLGIDKLNERHKYFMYIDKFYHYDVLICGIIQFPFLILLYFICNINCNQIVLNIKIIIDGLLLLIVIYCSIIEIKYLRTITFLIHNKLSLWSIMRSYFATIFCFGFIYFDGW